MFRLKKGRAPDSRAEQPSQPLRVLEFLDRVLDSPGKTRRMILIFTTAAFAVAAPIGVILALIPSESVQLIATMIFSSASAAVTSAIGFRIHGKRNRAPDERDDASN